jgi:hypothetical protein
MDNLTNADVINWQKDAVTQKFFKLINQHRRDAEQAICKGTTLNNPEKALMETAKVIGIIHALSEIIIDIQERLTND